MCLSGRAPSSRSAGFRLFGCAVALAAMLGQIGSFVHLAFTAHVRCAEHGELVETRSHGVTPVARDRRSSEARYAAAPADDDHGHEHCLVVSHRRDRSIQSGVTTVVTTAQLPFVARVFEAIGPPPGIDLILLAPKNSPPV